MKSGSWQIGIKDEDRHKTTFVVPHVHYKLNVMPFGPKNALLELLHRMDKAYKPIAEFCLVYINDALIFNNNEEEHAEYLLKFKYLAYKHG